MLRIILVVAVVSCAVFGAVEALPTPQHRFSLPSHFSFRTVHVPTQTVPKPGRLFAPATSQVSHVPVMVSVPQDFVGDSFVVSSNDLQNLPIMQVDATPAEQVPVEAPVEQMPVEAPVEQVPVEAPVEQMPVEAPVEQVSVDVIEESIPAEVIVESMLAEAPVEEMPVEEPVDPMPVVEEIVVPTDVQPVEEVVIVEAPIESLAQADDSFVLTASEPQAAETVDVVEPVVSEPEIIDTPIAAEEPVFVEEAVPAQVPGVSSPISPFETETFHAYNDFLNTWLQLASVNLNRPDLLRFVTNVGRPQPAASVVAEPQPIIQEEIFEPVPTPVEVIEPMAQEFVEVSEPMVEEIVEPEIFVEPSIQTDIVPEIVEPTLVEEQALEITESLPIEVPADTVSEPIVTPVDEQVVPEATPVGEIATEATLDVVTEADITEVATEVPVTEIETIVEPVAVVKAADVEDPQSNVLPELTPEIISSNSIAKSINSQNIAPDVNAVQESFPTLLQPIPRITSRGRLSGYRYSFSHVPQRGSFFLHSG